MRLCGDYKVTINQVSPNESYPLPQVELFTALSGGKLFSKIDLSGAYHEVSFHEDSRKYTTINTHKGLFQKYLRLPFGISSAPAMFRMIMKPCFKVYQKSVYIDDILISGTDEADHNSKFWIVYKHLASHKCVFSVPLIKYLGHIQTWGNSNR